MERKIQASEIIRVPRHLHKTLKLLSTVTGISMGAIVANIIEGVLTSNEKEITKIIKAGLE
jgi:predicted DNA-binding protein